MKPVFVITKNVNAFMAMMENVKSQVGTDSLGMVYGVAGRGKTRTSKWFSAQQDCVYVTSLRGWSELWMYQDILTAMGIRAEVAPKRKKDAFEAIIAQCAANPRPIILDEADLIGSRLLESVRDLCKVSMVPWVLVGEESLPGLMSRDRRVWSRCCAAMEFQPMTAAEIIPFTRQTADLAMTSETADLVQRSTTGDIRRIEKILAQSEIICRANRSREITDEIVRAAMRRVLPDQERK